MSTENAVAKAEKPDKTVVDGVLKRVNEFQQLGELKIPDGYSPENALKSAYLVLLETKTRDNQPVLQACTRESVANALLNMVVQGLSPMKKQCDFIAYGNKLTLQREYHGTIALAKRYGGVKDVFGNVIYQGDEFAYSIDEHGKKKVTKHEQKLENTDNEIVGAYATLIMQDGSVETEIMTMKKIRSSWEQGATKGNSPAHKNFPDQMAIKTVINRACKLKITTSDDSVLDSEQSDRVVEESREIIDQRANKEELTFDDVEEVEEVVDEESGEVYSEPVAEKSGQTVMAGPDF